jgi:hypothetical protein
MKSFFTTMAILICGGVSFSQTTEIITVKAGQNIFDAYKEIYRYPQFTAGRVYFMNGDVSAAKLNYNLISQAMLFTTNTGDTLAIDNESTIKYVTIEKDTFYYDEGYLELVENYNHVKLAIKQKIKFSDKKKMGAFGMPTSTLKTESDDTFLGDRRYNFTIAEDLIFKKETEFYLNDDSNHFLTISKKNLLKLYPKKKDNIENFLKENNINLREEKGIKLLVQFLNQSS